MRSLVLVVLLVACGKKAEPPPEPRDAIAFVGVTVLPMDREVALADHTVIVERGAIVAVGPSGDTPVPSGARTIDGRGKWLMPGLADMHVHTYDPRQLALFVAMGVTTVRVMWGDPASIGAREAIRRGDQRLAPSIITAGNIVDGKPPIWPGSLGVANPEEGVAAVEAQRRAGYDFVKVYALLSKPTYDAIVNAASKHKLPVAGHVPRDAGLEHVLERKQLSIEHLDGYMRAAERDDSPIRNEKSYFVRMGAYKYSDDAKLAAIVARTKAAGTWNCPTLVVQERIGKLDHPDANRPEYKYVSKAQIASWAPEKDFRFRSVGPDGFETMRGANAWFATLVKRLSDAGAGLLAGTDVGNPWLVPGYSLHDELALFVDAKLAPYQALRAATEAPGRYAGGEFGTIAPGKRADLVLLDADPLANIANTRKIAGVMLRGRWLAASDLDAERETLAAIYRGDRSRFEGVPLPSTQHAFTARYRITGDYQSGEERITAFDQTVIAEQRNDGEPDTRWMIVLGKDGKGAYLQVTHDGLDVTVTRNGGKLAIAGSLGKDTISMTESIADDEILGGAPLGVDTAYQRQLRSLAVDASTTLKLAVLELRPSVSISRITVEAKRLADGKRTVAGKELPVHVFEVSALGRSYVIALDEQGWPVTSASHERL
jgi:imidazolonepropionase-like amidohydrolase